MNMEISKDLKEFMLANGYQEHEIVPTLEGVLTSEWFKDHLVEMVQEEFLSMSGSLLMASLKLKTSMTIGF